MDPSPFAYFEGEIRPFADCKISIMNHTFLYGTGVFEGVRGYWDDQGRRLNISKRGASLSQRIGRVTLNSRGGGSIRILPGLSFRFGRR